MLIFTYVIVGTRTVENFINIQFKLIPLNFFQFFLLQLTSKTLLLIQLLFYNQILIQLVKNPIVLYSN